MDDVGRYSGADFEVKVAAHLGQGALVTSSTSAPDGALAVRSDRYDVSQLDSALTEELLEVWQELAKRNRAIISRSHDFTYPANVERLYVTDPVPVGEIEMSPRIKPWVGLWDMYDRRVTNTDVPKIKFMSYDEYVQEGGQRWTIHNGALHYSDYIGMRGPSADADLRIDYIPYPRPISHSSTEVRTDIPGELHGPLALGAALRLGTSINSARIKTLGPASAVAYSRAFSSLAQAVKQSEFVEWTREPLSERGSNRAWRRIR